MNDEVNSGETQGIDDQMASASVDENMNIGSPEQHPVDQMMQQYRAKYGSCPVMIIPDPLSGDAFAQEQAMMHMLEQTVENFSKSQRLSKDEVARVARWFSDKYAHPAPEAPETLRSYH